MYSFYSRIAYLKKQRQLAFIARHIRALGVLSLLGVVLMLVLLRAQADSFYAGGTGTREDPYQIATCEQLQEMRQNLSSYYILINDIDCQSIVQGVGWEPVGKDWNNRFSGVLDGQNHMVTNFGVSTTSSAGMFRNVNGSVIKNLHLRRGSIGGTIQGGAGGTGALAGSVYKSSIRNVSSDIPVIVSSGDSVGGLIGFFRDGYLTQSSVDATVSASSSSKVGGLVGYTRWFGVVVDSYASGTVVGSAYVGGLIGSAYGGVINSYSTSHVTITGGGNTAGGLVGYFFNTYENGGLGSVNIVNSFATGQVTGNGGGLVGQYATNNSFANLQNSYFDQTGTGKTSCVASPSLTSSSGICQAVNTDGLSPSYFYASTSAPLSSWDFTHTWIEHASSTPTLATSSLYLPYSGTGSGTLSNPYQISSCTELQSLDTSDPSAYYVLVNDIDCTGFPFSPIGLNGNAFTGVLDGQGYTISNLTVSKPNAVFVGIFSSAVHARFVNISFDDITVSGAGFVGGLVGISAKNIFDGVHATTSVSRGWSEYWTMGGVNWSV